VLKRKSKRGKMETAVIIGAGPAGLTAGYELLKTDKYKVVIIEKTKSIGGISQTANYKGNRIDIGGHRFFSKSEKVLQWWNNIMPLQSLPSKDDIALGRVPKPLGEDVLADPEKSDNVMLIRKRISRIYYLRRFFDYPISLNYSTIKNLGLKRTLKIGTSYLKVLLFPKKNEKNLEEFFINRFGKELYKTFFKDYTEKVWGKKCTEIKPDWGAQRIKGLSIKSAILHAFKKIVSVNKSNNKVETSLIEQFHYPKLGPGQLWEKAALEIKEMGGEIFMECELNEIFFEDKNITALSYRNLSTKESITINCDFLLSSAPVKDLISSFTGSVPDNVRNIASNLDYRDFITVGLLVKKLKIKNESNIKTVNDIIPDNWIYVQEKDVKIGRIQIFNNWSPYMVRDDKNVWMGLEYFCNEGDSLWEMSDEKFIDFATNEMIKINFIENTDSVIDATVIRIPKAYPGYFGVYENFDQVREFTDKIPNLFLIGRNGMHRYNNADHSMLTAMEAVTNIKNNIQLKDNIWSVNTEEDFHETKK